MFGALFFGQLFLEIYQAPEPESWIKNFSRFRVSDLLDIYKICGPVSHARKQLPANFSAISADDLTHQNSLLNQPIYWEAQLPVPPLFMPDQEPFA